MSERPALAAFQEAAVRHIVARLTDKTGSGRFLLADEVGLGKTIVASEVIERLAREHAGRHRSDAFNVVYLCSNTEIAEQNRKKLVRDAGASVRRVSQLAVHRKGSGPSVRLYSFTPGTSLYASTGIAWERRLILYLLGRVLRFDVARKPWRTYFRCAVRGDSWERATKPRPLAMEFWRRTTTEFQDRIGHSWRSARVKLDRTDEAGRELTKVLPELVGGFDETRPLDREHRNAVIRALRTGLLEVALEHIEPHLVILDEVQKFGDILKVNARENSIERRLFANPHTRVLILSATPYKLLTLEHETDESGAGHYEDFLRTLRFLFNDETPVRRIEQNLVRFRKQLGVGQFLRGPDDVLRGIKRQLETDLKKVVSRTERNWYVEDIKKGIEDVGLDGVDVAAPPVEELAEFIRLRRFLGADVPAGSQITEYWKSAPAVLSFMDQGYAVMKHIRRPGVRVPRELICSEDEIADLPRRSHRFRSVLDSLWPPGVESTKQGWRFLWVQPTYKYYTDDFFRGEDPSKLLVFSSWRFVPKAVSVLLSAEAQQRILPRVDDEEAQPLRFAQKDDRLAFHIFDLCFPSPSLARVAPLGEWANAGVSVEALIRRAEEAMTALLSSRGILVGDVKQGSLWQIVARLDATELDRGASICASLKGASIGARSGTDNVVFEKYRQQWLEWATDAKSKLRVTRAMVTRLARIALFSPAVSLLRALWSALPVTRATVPSSLVETCLTGLRAYLNRGLVRAVVEDHEPGRVHYTDRVLAYCRDAHLQAVLDEYLWLRGETVRADDAEALDEFIVTIGQVFGLSTGTPRTNGRRGIGPEVWLEPDSVHHRAHFAIAFGDVAEADVDDPYASGAGRRTAVREAFNSPFWPFVLSTTSVGQEGLDFHLFCRDIVHWNLPWNPVDLEQREGRINRRNSLAIRRSIAADWPLSRVPVRDGDAGASVWPRLFAAVAASDDRQRYKRGLFPSWIYDCSDPTKVARIRRHLPFHPMSDDAHRYTALKDRLALYRLVFGQPRQQDLLEHLQQQMTDDSADISDEVRMGIAAYMINLSPFPESYARELAGKEAADVLRSPVAAERIRTLLADVAAMRQRFAPRLASVVQQIDALVAIAETHASGHVVDGRVVRRAVAALVYLANPFDDEFDMHGADGLSDDIDVVRKAHSYVERMRAGRLNRVHLTPDPARS